MTAIRQSNLCSLVNVLTHSAERKGAARRKSVAAGRPRASAFNARRESVGMDAGTVLDQSCGATWEVRVVRVQEHLSPAAYPSRDDVPSTNDCTLSMLTGPAHAPFIGMTLPHLLRMCAFDFRDVIIVVDDLPKEGRNADAAGDLLITLNKMQDEEIVSRTLRLSTAHGRDRNSPRVLRARAAQRSRSPWHPATRLGRGTG